jgi:hypothetical protein
MNTTQFWPAFGLLLVDSLEVMKVPAISLVCLVLSAGMAASFRGGRWKPHYWLVFTQFLFVPLVATVGALFQAGMRNPAEPLPKATPVGDWLIYILFYLSLALSVFWIYRMNGLRCFGLCLLAIQEIVLLGAIFAAGMSISGAWI